MRQFLNSIMQGSAKGHSWERSGVWWKRRYLQINLDRSFLRNLLSDMCIHFTELMLTLCCPVSKLCLWRICEGIFSNAQRLVASNETSSDEKCRETFWATALWCVHSSHRVKPFFGLSRLKPLFLWNLRKDIWERSLDHGEKKYPQVKSRRKHSVILLCVVLTALTQLSPSFHWAVF